VVLAACAHEGDGLTQVVGEGEERPVRQHTRVPVDPGVAHRHLGADTAARAEQQRQRQQACELRSGHRQRCRASAVALVRR
jgi:hypothetical protein